MTTDNPFETLAACFEIADAIKSGDPENFVSNLPVYQDGTCNGYQHWSAIGRDIVGAEASNVIQFSVRKKRRKLHVIFYQFFRWDFFSNSNSVETSPKRLVYRTFE